MAAGHEAGPGESEAGATRLPGGLARPLIPSAADYNRSRTFWAAFSPLMKDSSVHW